jgi:hypothetical protein
MAARSRCVGVFCRFRSTRYTPPTSMPGWRCATSCARAQRRSSSTSQLRSAGVRESRIDTSANLARISHRAPGSKLLASMLDASVSHRWASGFGAYPAIEQRPIGLASAGRVCGFPHPRPWQLTSARDRAGRVVTHRRTCRSAPALAGVQLLELTWGKAETLGAFDFGRDAQLQHERGSAGISTSASLFQVRDCRAQRGAGAPRIACGQRPSSFNQLLGDLLTPK